MGNQQWYREKRIELIKESQDMLRELLLIPLQKLDSIPFHFFEKLRMDLVECLSRINKSQRDGSGSYISPNGGDAAATTIPKNADFEIIKKRFDEVFKDNSEEVAA